MSRNQTIVMPHASDYKPVGISFVVPHKGRENLLVETLVSISRLDYRKDYVEVIVVTQNDELEDKTISVMQCVNGKVICESDNVTISRLRNIGVQHATNDYIAFLDADVELSPNWAVSMVKVLHEDTDRVVVSAVQACQEGAPVLERIRTALSNIQIDCAVKFLPGRNLLLRKSTFDAIGGFPDWLTTCEDYYFTQKAAELGTLYYSSAASYIHLGEDKEFGSMFKKEIWRGQSNLHSIFGREVPLEELPSFIVPNAFVLLVLLALGASGFKLMVLAMLFLALAFALPALYALRLYRQYSAGPGFADIFLFYSVYFPARSIGTVIGLFKTFKYRRVQ